MAASDFRQRLVAILAADAVGYSRLMSIDEGATVTSLDGARVVFRRHIEANRGRVIDMAGDSVLAVFETATGAVTSAIAIQRDLRAALTAVPEDRCMRFRIGLHMGDVIEKADGTVYGDGVNIAARLEGLAEPGGIAVSDSIRTAVRGKVDASFADQGAQQVKNIAEPVRVFRVNAQTTATDPTAIAHAAVRMSVPVPGFGRRPAIAVLAFDNMSGDQDQEYFADGLAEDILTRLAAWRWLPVIARNSSFSFKGRAVDIKEVGRALGARYVLEGSVRKGGNRVRVTAQLIDAESGHHVWAQRYDRVLDDLFAMQDELTDGIVGALEGTLGKAELERARLKPPSSLEAWEACQRGIWHVYRFTREDFDAAVPLFRRAAELDPGISQAASGIASVRMFEGFFLWSANPAGAIAEAAMHAGQALQIDGHDAFALAILGSALTLGGRLDEGLAMSRRAVELNPSGVLGYQALGVSHLFRGDGLPGVQACETAIRISPNDVALRTLLSTCSACSYMARDYERAVEIAKLAVQRAPQYPIGWRSLANALGQLGLLDEARDALAQLLKLMPGYTTEAAARVSVGIRDEAVFQHYLEGLRKAGWQG